MTRGWPPSPEGSLASLPFRSQRLTGALYTPCPALPTKMSSKLDETSSFSPPSFREYWAVGGTAIVNQNFVRLTPDRQSKKGAIWSHRPLACDNFTTTIKFRIHGQVRGRGRLV